MNTLLSHINNKSVIINSQQLQKQLYSSANNKTRFDFNNSNPHINKLKK